MAEQHDMNPLVAGLFGLANTFATPLAKSLVEDKLQKQDATQVANSTVNERINWSRLNGSGPADAVTARASAPTTLQGFIAGEGNVAQVETKKSNNTILFVVLGLLGAMLLLLVARKT